MGEIQLVFHKKTILNLNPGQKYPQLMYRRLFKRRASLNTKQMW